MPSDSKRPQPRITKHPHTPAPELLCPSCEEELRYHATVYGGVQPPERWDQYACPTCGQFEFRQRTRKLRSVPPFP
jgi:predicted RNA-binding Zn-ribbon protein involved in translation (DUF1610 family)